MVRARSGWSGACACGDGELAPLGGADGHMVSGGGDPWGEGSGDGGAAAFIVDIWGSIVPRAFFLGGGTEELGPPVTSTPSIKLSTFNDRFLPNRSTASLRFTMGVLSPLSSLLTICHPDPPTTSSSTSSSPASPSRNVARVPFGNSKGKCLKDCGKGAFRRG